MKLLRVHVDDFGGRHVAAYSREEGAWGSICGLPTVQDMSEDGEPDCAACLTTPLSHLPEVKLETVLAKRRLMRRRRAVLLVR